MVPAPAIAGSVRRLRTLALVCVGVLLSLYLVMVRTEWGQAVADGAFLARLSEARVLRTLDKRFLESIDVWVLIAGGLVLFLVAGIRRRWRAGIAVAVAYGLAIASAELLKMFLPQPILAVAFEESMGTKAGLNTLPSGHTTFATALVLGLVLLVAPRVRVPVAIVGTGLMIVVAGGVVTAGWHRPTDAFGGVALGSAWMAVTAAALLARRGAPGVRPRAEHLVPLVGAGLAALASIVLVALLRHPEVTGSLTLMVIKVTLFACIVTVVSLFTAAVGGSDLSEN
jgi:membrane-associated phospholipid phosphatase